MTMTLKELLELAASYDIQLPALQVGEVPGGADLAGVIDHTLLKADATQSQIETLCKEARQYGFASVCVNPIAVPISAHRLAGTPVKVCTVIGFPLGAVPTRFKVAEAQWCLAEGARELDMVIPVGWLKSSKYEYVLEDIQGVVAAARQVAGALVKVILEMALLTRREKIIGCLLTRQAGAEFVKTSTGFGPSGATVEDVTLMSAVVGGPGGLGVKAAGGIRTLEDATAMLKAGATRLGASAGVKIMQQALKADAPCQ
jgi:deoxyribose-phosphate aldolase